MKTAILIGASGLIGNFVLQNLLVESSYQNVIILVRRLLPIQHIKLQQIVTDFTDEHILKEAIKGDDVFICTGTTIKKAGGKEVFKAIDFDLPFRIGQVAKENNVGKVLLISSAGANEKSIFFYQQIKGLLESALSQLQLNHLIIIRPSLLLGHRAESRKLEAISQSLFKITSFLFVGNLKKYKGIEARKVASKMVEYATSATTQKVIFVENIDLLA